MARTAERGLFDFFFLAEGCACASTAVASTTSTWSAGPTPSPSSPRWPRSPTVSAWPAPSTPRSTNPSRWHGNSPPSTTYPTAGPAGTWSPRRTPSPARTSAAADSCHSDRYQRAEEFVVVAREFWDSWAPDAVIADRDTGVYVDPDRIREVEHRGPQFDVRGRATLPRAPQGHPVLLQAGDSADGRAFLAQLRRRDVHPALGSGGRPGLLRGRQGAGRVVRPRSQSAQGLSGGHVRARRHARRGGREGPPYPPSAGRPADRDRDARAGVAARPVGLRPRRPAARRRPGRRPDHHAGPGSTRRPEGRRRQLARACSKPTSSASASW